jgi:uncharacterized lipoprotein YajG
MRSASAVTRVSVVLVTFGLLAGCATSPKVIFTKPGVSAADRERDENACLRSSVGLDDQSRIMVPFDVDRNAFQSCMAARGYTATARP